MGALVGSICLSDIPKDKITTGKNGKKYLNIYVGERQEPSKYGQTHFISVNQMPEEGKEKPAPIYIGELKVLAKKKEEPQQKKETFEPEDGDLPF